MFYDFARKLQVTFQDPATPIAEGIIDLHHEIFHWLIIIFVPVVVIFLRIVIRSIRVWSDPQTIKSLDKRRLSYAFSGITHGTLLEIIWTITPTIILILIAIPSFGLIYAMDTIIDPDFTIKVIGNQWYWTYDFNYRAFLLGDINDIYAALTYSKVLEPKVLPRMSDLKQYIIEQTARLWSHNVKNYLIDSYMLSENMLTKKKGLRLLSVDNPIALPIFTNIRVLITASDVLHSFAIPSFGIKMDATPGRLSAVPLFIERPGNFFGQCSELCGIGHGVMPIEIIGYSNMSKDFYLVQHLLDQYLNLLKFRALLDEYQDIVKNATHFGLVLGLSLKKKALVSRLLKRDRDIPDVYQQVNSRVQKSPHFVAVLRLAEQQALEHDPKRIDNTPEPVLRLAAVSFLLDIIAYIDDFIVELEDEQRDRSLDLAKYRQRQAELNKLNKLNKKLFFEKFGEVLDNHACLVRSVRMQQAVGEQIKFAHKYVKQNHYKELKALLKKDNTIFWKDEEENEPNS